MSPAERTSTDIDAVADRYLDASAAHDPTFATFVGIPGHDTELPALDPDWYAARSDLRRATLAELDGSTAVDACDRITAAALRSELGVLEALRDLGDEEGQIRNIDSPVQVVRDMFDLMSTANEDDWQVVAERLAAVPASLEGYRASLRWAAERGRVRPKRAVQAALAQCAGNVGADGFFATFARGARTADGAELGAALRTDVERGAALASDAYDALATFLREDLLPQAGERDAVGREAYALHSQRHLGTAVDLDEAYAWGQDELARITEEMRRTAGLIKPGASVAEAIAVLDEDPEQLLDGTDALQAWMQQTADAAVAALGGTHFDIPEPIRRLSCRIAPTHEGGIYYTPPSDDLVTRPGTMWWSVPDGVTRFGTWRERTTVYHEGVPGHHLQVAQTIYRRELLNRWRRIGSWISGQGEGWALYAERLMAELGFLDAPADYLGMLDGQSMRAARVVIDIGVHCDLPAPAEVGGGEWTYDKAWALLDAHTNMAEGFKRFELDRYLGWPGQAPSYKLGERIWLQLREEAREREGAAFDLAAFHRRALDVGSVGLDVLRGAVLGEFD